METNGWRAPDHNFLDLVREVAVQFSNPSGGFIDPMAFYLDPQGAMEWCFRINQGTKIETFSSLPAHWTSWAVGLILRHLKGTTFDQTRVDVLGLGVGDGKKETTLCDALIKQANLARLRCMLLDISPALAEEAHAHFLSCLGDHPLVNVAWGLGNYHNLPFYDDLFCKPEHSRILKIGTLFIIIDNIHHETNFIEQSLRAFKSGDLLVIDCCLGYAPPDEPDRIAEEDPSLTFLGDSTFHWYRSVIQRFRPDVKDIDLQFHLRYGLSTIPNTYTIEVTATLDQKASFSVMLRHRYVADDFVRAFESRGWKPLGGLTYGPEKKQLLYIFAKK